MTQPARVDVRRVTKFRDASHVGVTAITFRIDPGEVYGLLGGAGAGKSILVRILFGLAVADEGEVTINGWNVRTDPLLCRRAMTLITGDGTLFGAMTVQQNLAFVTRVASPAKRSTRTDRRTVLRLMGMPDRLLDTRVKFLPRELVVTLWLAVAWLRETPVLVLDAPERGLDTKAVARLQTTLDMFRARGTAVLLATADLLFASQAADRLGIVKQGRLVAEYTRGELLSRSLTELYADYVGRVSSRASLDHLRLPRQLTQ